MNVWKFEIHDVTVASSKFEVTSTKIFMLELLNIHKLLLQYIFLLHELQVRIDE